MQNLPQIKGKIFNNSWKKIKLVNCKFVTPFLFFFFFVLECDTEQNTTKIEQNKHLRH